MTIEKQIKNYFESNKTISKEDLSKAIKVDFPNWSDNTINTYLYKLKKRGIINNLSRGVYILGDIETFTPQINDQLKKIAKQIQKNYPFISYCVWNSTWLNDLMRHQPFKNSTIVEVEKVAAEQVFNELTSSFSNVFINPDELFFDRYMGNLNNIIIIKNLISEAPIVENKKVYIPTLEKILVDILIDKELFAAQQGELDFIFKSAFYKYDINKAKMKRYAARRNREEEVEKIINISLAK